MSPVLADAIFWVAVVCCVVAQAALLRSQLAAPARGGAADAPARRAGEVVWAVLPAVMLALALVWTWRTLHPRPTPGAPAALTVSADVPAARAGGAL
jgi:heme/copper-type cytochrome/quinol oxidase subunit 2